MAISLRRRTGRLVFLAVSSAVVILLLLSANSLLKQLSLQERERMNIWARATERLARESEHKDMEFLLGIISQNSSIPVLVADSSFRILDFRNFPLPETGLGATVAFDSLPARDREYLSGRLRRGAGGLTLHEACVSDPHFIRVDAGERGPQFIYYEDSLLLRRLSLFPYLQLGVMVVLLAIIYLAVSYSGKAERNRLWAGLSKETAHQLGTPISSLMAWNELLRASGVSEEITSEIGKDIDRLSVISDRFSKIGSRPELKRENIGEIVDEAARYLQTRVSTRIQMVNEVGSESGDAMLSRQLFSWVLENLIRNAADAMAGEGRITLRSGREKGRIWIEVADTGKGISRKNYKTVFQAGFTTKKRGWGLGLALAKRIVEDYHGGRIFVKESGSSGSIFRIELPSMQTK